MSNRREWLKKRANRIGGSEIACVLGLNPWKSNVQLWREKMGYEQAEDISDNPAVAYGINAEPLIRDVFKLNHDGISVDYIPNNLWLNDEFPFAHASLDGWLEDKNREMGVLEIKTGSAFTAKQRKEWKDRIPDHYYCQILWYMMVTGAKFAWLTAMLKCRDASGDYQVIRDYELIRDAKVEAEIAMLADKGREFWESLQSGIEPPLILPGV